VTAAKGRPGAASPRMARLSRPPERVWPGRPGPEAAAHGAAPQGAPLLDQRRERAGWDGREIAPVEVAAEAGRAGAELEQGGAGEHGHRGDVGAAAQAVAAEGDRFAQRFGVGGAGGAGGQNAAHAAGEGEAAGGGGVVERQAGEAVDGEEEGARLAAPQGELELAVEEAEGLGAAVEQGGEQRGAEGGGARRVGGGGVDQAAGVEQLAGHPQAVVGARAGGGRFGGGGQRGRLEQADAEPRLGVQRQGLAGIGAQGARHRGEHRAGVGARVVGDPAEEEAHPGSGAASRSQRARRGPPGSRPSTSRSGRAKARRSAASEPRP
jgi:hypothetical protein